MLTVLIISLSVMVLSFIALLIIFRDEKEIAQFIFISISIGIFVFIVGTIIYILIVYGSKPMDEIPAWVRWFMQNGNKS